MSREMTGEVCEVPVFPLPRAILFPGVMLPLHIFEDRYKVMVEHAIRTDRHIAIALLREDPPGKPGPSRVCGLGEIVEVEELEHGRKNILLRGVARIALEEIVQEVPYIRARARLLRERAGGEASAARRRREVAWQAQQLLFLVNSREAGRFIHLLSYMEDAAFLTDFIAFHLLQDQGQRQAMLENLDVDDRMRRVHHLLSEALARLEP